MGARKRLPVHPLLSKLRTLGTLAVLIAMFATIVTTSQADAKVRDNAYTGENFDWSIEWDGDVWRFDDEENSEGSDFFSLITRDYNSSTAMFLAIEGLPDLEECVNSWAEMILGVSGSEDYEQLEHTDAIETRPGGAAAVFRYDVVTQGSTVSTASYVQCFPMMDDVVLRVSVLTDLRPREKTFARVEDILKTLETSKSASDSEDSSDAPDNTRQFDDDDANDRDREEDEDDENARDDDDSTRGDDDDVDRQDDRDDGDQDDESADDRDDDTNQSVDDDQRDEDTAETGIDGNQYVSPTYDFSVEWDDDVWTVDPDEELINELPDDMALDRLVLDTETSTLYIEGRTDFDDGDLEACVDHDIDALEQTSEISNLDVREDENGDPMEGETADGAYKVITLTLEDTNLTEYIECRPIDEGESVLVITLITKASNLDDATVDMADVIESIEI